MPPDDTDGLDDADLPGLDDPPPSPEPEASAQAPSRKWTEAELDRWFESDFGGHDALAAFYPSRDLDDIEVQPADNPDPYFGLRAYKELAYDEQTPWARVPTPWPVLSHEAKERFRRGWLLRYGNRSPLELLAKWEDPRLGRFLAKRGLGRRWIFVVGGPGVIGLVLVVGFFLFGGSESSDTDTAPPSSSEATAQDAEETASAGAFAEPAPQVAAANEPIAPVEERFEATIGASRFVVMAPTQVTSGGRLRFTVCSYDAASGSPRAGETGFFSIGRDPAGPQASHASGTLGSAGCFSGEVEVKESPGATGVLTSDGKDSATVGEITIVAADG